MDCRQETQDRPTGRLVFKPPKIRAQFPLFRVNRADKAQLRALNKKAL